MNNSQAIDQEYEAKRKAIVGPTCGNCGARIPPPEIGAGVTTSTDAAGKAAAMQSNASQPGLMMKKEKIEMFEKIKK
jgi:hypothetical protein